MTYTRVRSYFNTSLYVTHLSWQNTVLPCINHLYSLHTTNMLWAHRLTQLSLWRKKRIHLPLHKRRCTHKATHLGGHDGVHMKHTHCTDGLLPTSHMTMMVCRAHPSWNLSTLLAFTHCFSSWILALGRQMSRVGIKLPAGCKPHFRDFIFVGWGSGTQVFKGIGRGWTR